MVKVKYIVLLLLLPAAAATAYAHFFKSDSARIHRQITCLAETACKNGPESELACSVAARKISRLFSSPCRVEARGYSVSKSYSPDDLASSLAYARFQHEIIDMEVYDILIEDVRETTATAVFTAVLTSTEGSGAPEKAFNEVAVEMEKRGRDWLFSEVRVVNVLER